MTRADSRYGATVILLVATTSCGGCGGCEKSSSDANETVSPVAPVSAGLDATAPEATTVDAAAADDAGFDLRVVARYEGFRAAWVVHEKLVLVGCRRLRVLGPDRRVLHDFAISVISDPSAACENRVVGIVGNAVVASGTPPHAVDVDTGKATVYDPAKDPASEFSPPSGYYTAFRGVVAFDSSRPSPTGYDSFSFVKGEHALYVFGHNGLLRAIDPKTGLVLWEYGIGIEAGPTFPPVLWKENGNEAVLSPSKSANGTDAILLFERAVGSPADDPPWTGTVRGRVLDPSLPSGVRQHCAVFVGDQVATTDDAGLYSADASVRGVLRVSIADAPASGVAPSKILVPDGDAGSYIVDVTAPPQDRGFLRQ